MDEVIGSSPIISFLKATIQNVGFLTTTINKCILPENLMLLLAIERFALFFRFANTVSSMLIQEGVHIITQTPPGFYSSQQLRYDNRLFRRLVDKRTERAFNVLKRKLGNVFTDIQLSACNQFQCLLVLCHSGCVGTEHARFLIMD